MKKKLITCDYELMYIVDQKFKELKGLEDKILGWLDLKTWKMTDWGEKKFAYPIKKQLAGRYILANFTCDREKILVLKEKIRWLPEVLRFLVINLSTEKHFKHRKSKRSFIHKNKEKEASLEKNTDTKTETKDLNKEAKTSTPETKTIVKEIKETKTIKKETKTSDKTEKK